MSAANVLNSDTLIRDGEIYRHDWEGFPRFYLVRIYPDAKLMTFRVKVHVQLEGDPTAWHSAVCDDIQNDINEAVFDCVSEVETLCWNRWEAEAWAERRDQLTRYERRFGI